MRVGFFVAAGLLVAVLTAFAQTTNRTVDQKDQTKEQEPKKHLIYEWTDGKGVVHITDQLGKVPARYRSTVRRVEAPAGEEAESIERQGLPDSGIADKENREADLKEDWQQRMKEAKRHLASLEKRYRELDQKRSELQGRWGGAASGHLEDKAEAERIGQEMKQVQQEIDDARNQVEVVIPDEARKAGIPPGWLRD
jgi:uncharacterized protein YukE